MRTMDELDYFSEERFKGSRSKTIAILNKRSPFNPVEIEQINQVLKEDIKLEIKFRTQRKCIYRFAISSITISLGIILCKVIPLFYLLTSLAGIVLVSSLVGIYTNQTSALERKYLSR